MDRGKKPMFTVANKNNQIYMDLKGIIRENTLRYLPAKCLRRCTGVCREWKLYISTPFFAHNQSNSFKGLSGFFCQSVKSMPPSFISLDSLAYGIPDPSLNFLPEKVNIKCSSNGLVCCQGQTGARPYYICNPVTKQWKKLPKSDADHGSDPSLVLIFKPSLLNFVAEFKIVCPFKSDLDGYEFDIYTSSDNSWRTSRDIMFGQRNIIPNSGVHINGIVYWHTTNRGGLIAFDLTNERSTLVYSYSSLHTYRDSGCFGEFNGKPCFAALNKPTLTIDELGNAHHNTMQLSSRSKAWNANQITLSNSLFAGHTTHGKLMFLGGNFAIVLFGKVLVSYNLKTNDVKLLSNAAEDYTTMVPYVNSLVEI